MKRRIPIRLAAVALLITGSVLLLNRRASRIDGTASAHPLFATAEAARTSAPPPAAAASKPGAAAISTAPRAAAGPNQMAPPTASIDRSAPVDPATRAEVVAVLADQRTLYAEVGALSWDETKALVARRRKAADELVERLARLGPGGSRAIAEAYSGTEDTRARLLLVAALGRIADPEASAVLHALMGLDHTFSARKEMVAALGQRNEPASSAMLTDLLQNQQDPRLRAVGVQAMSGRADALPVLMERVLTDPSRDVRMESIRSVGLIGNQAARDELAGIAKGSMEASVRQAAIQELARSFGAGALEVVDGLLSDPEENIRTSAVKGIARIQTEYAVDSEAGARRRR
jgi:HEAT repeat protein